MQPTRPVPAPLEELMRRWTGLRVVVVGDVVLDVWTSAGTRRMCREAPALAVQVRDSSYAVGGAANTAANLAAMGAQTTLVGVRGVDPAGARLESLLATADVTSRLLPVAGHMTPTKHRVVSEGQVLLRLDNGNSSQLSPRGAAQLLAGVRAALDEGPDALVVCDYGYGVGATSLPRLLLDRRSDIPLLVVDAHDLRPWAAVRPDLATPSFEEALRVLNGDGKRDAPPEAGEERVPWIEERRGPLLRATLASMLAVTLDVDGAVVLHGDESAYRTYGSPVVASRSVGAGDAFVAACTVALAAGGSLARAADLGQLAATVVTSADGTTVCSAAELMARVKSDNDSDAKIVDQQTLAYRAARYRDAGRRVVFTNGCFDVLHSGHVAYLQQARRLGDVLIVAVNSDASIRSLKGPMRPVNSQEDRMAVIAGLSAVDIVVMFDGVSPTALLEDVRPQIYAKGGDHRAELLPEAPLVERLGGEVKIMDYVPDRSTSILIERIRSRSPEVHSSP